MARRVGDIGRGAGLVAAAALCLASAAARAQAVCGARADFLRHLEANHGEAPTAMGLTGTGKVIEVLTSASGSWTIIITEPGGKTCLVAAGEGWQTLAPPQAPAPGEAS